MEVAEEDREEAKEGGKEAGMGGRGGRRYSTGTSVAGTSVKYPAPSRLSSHYHHIYHHYHHHHNHTAASPLGR